MNRRSFLRFCGIVPIVPMIAVEALTASPIIKKTFLLEINLKDNATPYIKSWTPGSESMYIKSPKINDKWVRI